MIRQQVFDVPLEDNLHANTIQELFFDAELSRIDDPERTSCLSYIVDTHDHNGNYRFSKGISSKRLPLTYYGKLFYPDPFHYDEVEDMLHYLAREYTMVVPDFNGSDVSALTVGSGGKLFFGAKAAFKEKKPKIFLIPSIREEFRSVHYHIVIPHQVLKNIDPNYSMQ